MGSGRPCDCGCGCGGTAWNPYDETKCYACANGMCSPGPDDND